LDAVDNPQWQRPNRLSRGGGFRKTRPRLARSRLRRPDLETVIQDLLSGQYKNPIRVVAFNTEERWSEDVSEDVAYELRRRCDLQARDVPSSIQDFVERHEGAAWRQLTLRLV
jgi:hypothetical protein